MTYHLTMVSTCVLQSTWFVQKSFASFQASQNRLLQPSSGFIGNLRRKPVNPNKNNRRRK